MKILLLTYEYPPFKGGVATYLSNLMQAAPAGVEVVVDVPPKGEHWIKTAWRIFFKVHKEKPDLFAISHVLPAGYVAWKTRIWTNTPYLVFTHGTDILTARKNAWKRFWMRLVLRHAKFVIANSRFTAGLLKEEGIEKVEIIPPAIDIPLLTTHYSLPPHIISIGRLVPRKGFDTLIKAMPRIITEVPNAHLTIIGRGDRYDELVSLAHEFRVETFVKILTDTDDATRSKYLSGSSVFVLAARQTGNDVEGFGIVTLEASAAGLPVVVGNSGGASEPVVHGVTGIVVAPNDPIVLSEAIIRLLNDPAEAAAMGAAGREYVAREYSIDVIAKRFWKIIMSPRSQTGSTTVDSGFRRNDD